MNALKNFFVNDWFFAVPMTVIAFIAFALVAWRFLLNLSAKSRLDEVWPDLQETLKRKGVIRQKHPI